MNLLRLRRFTLVAAFFSWLLLTLIASSALYLWHSADVEKLKGYYPYYDLKEHQYKLSSKRPKDWISLHKVSKNAKWAIIVSEDWAFYQHEGLDVQQLKIVVEETVEQHKFVRGASTITQQVVKNTLLSNERSLWRKFREMIMAYKLERVMNKDHILEIYLNIVEFGKNLYGINKAAHYYFNKPPALLTAREGAFLAMLLPSPVKYASSFRKKELTPFAKEVIDSILVKLRQAKVYDEEQRVLESQKLFYWETKKEESTVEDNQDDHLDYQVYE